MTTNYPRTLAAVKKSENAQWEIGDALIAEIGPPPKSSVVDGSRKKLEVVAKELQANGFDYQVDTLLDLRNIAAAFPPRSRLPALGFSLHQTARNPETLNAIVEGAPRGKKITRLYIREVVAAQALAHLRELEAEKERRAHNAEIARREREAAEDAARKATSASERRAAEERAAAASKRLEQNRVPPTKKDIPKSKPSPEDTPILIAKMEFNRDLNGVKLQLKRMRENIEPFVKAGVMTQTDVDLGIEELVSIQQLTDALLKLLREKQTTKGSHLSVVGAA